MSFRNVCREYRREYSREMIFGLVLLMLVGLSTWLGTYIPESLYLNGITQIMNGCIATVCLSGAWLMIRHADGMKIRKIWAVVLFVYAFFFNHTSDAGHFNSRSTSNRFYESARMADAGR